MRNFSTLFLQVVMEKRRRTRAQREADGTAHDDRVCPVCGRTFSAQSNLSKHLKSHGPRSVACALCDKLFYTDTAMKQHVKSVHEEGQWPCQFCGKVRVRG